MTPKQELPEVKALAARYNRAKERYEELRDELKAAIVEELRAGARPADLHRASGWDREYLRRIKTAADKADAEAEAARMRSSGGNVSVVAAPKKLASTPEQIPLTSLQLANLADLARSRATSERLARLEAAAKRAKPDDADLAVVEEAYRMNLIRDADVQH